MTEPGLQSGSLIWGSDCVGSPPLGGVAPGGVVVLQADLVVLKCVVGIRHNFWPAAYWTANCCRSAVLSQVLSAVPFPSVSTLASPPVMLRIWMTTPAGSGVHTALTVS